MSAASVGALGSEPMRAACIATLGSEPMRAACIATLGSEPMRAACIAALALLRYVAAANAPARGDTSSPGTGTT